MAIAIFHNFLDNIGGAEIVTLLLARELGADVYTTNIDQEKIKKMGFSDLNIYSIGWVPAAAPLRQELTYWRFRFLNLGKRYNFYIISGDWAMAAAVKKAFNPEAILYEQAPDQDMLNAVVKDLAEAHQKV